MMAGDWCVVMMTGLACADDGVLMMAGLVCADEGGTGVH